ncbi:MAG: lysophospholipid acyltransferase family protein [Candidatus Zhuqueibacterota bacterium]
MQTSSNQINRIQRLVINVLLLFGGRLIKVENASRFTSPEDPVIYAFNHNNAFETVLIPAYLIRARRWKKVSFIIDWMYGKIPLVGWFCRQTEPVYVYNKRARFKLYERFRLQHRSEDVFVKIIEKLNQQRSIGIFPEGKRNKNPYILRRGFNGVGYIALMAKAPVIPVGIEFQSSRKKGKMPGVGRFILRVGEPRIFAQAIHQVEQIERDDSIDPHAKKKLIHFHASEVTYHIMMDISRLSRKEYPYLAPSLAENFEKHIFSEIMR